MNHSWASIKQKVYSKVISAVPAEYYDIREETTPKAGWIPMLAFTVLVYVTAVASFTALYLNEASKSTTETVIVPYDKTGNDGYTCQMISRVSATYQIRSPDPALAYNLVNVIELQAQCTADLQNANPCNTSLTYFPGTTTALPVGTDYGAAVLYADNLLFIFDTTLDPYLRNYDYTTGLINDNIYQVDYFAIPTSLAVDRDGWPVYVAKSDFSSDKIVYRAFIDDSTVDLISFNTGWQYDITILNDNLYNVYMIQNNTFLSLDVYTVPAVSTVMFSTAADERILYAAVYHDGAVPTVYYTTTRTYDEFAIIMYRDGVNTTLNSAAFSYPLKGIAVSGSNQLYFLQLEAAFGGIYSLMQYIFTSDSTDTIAVIETISAPTAFIINPSGERLFITDESIYGIQELTFVYPQLHTVGQAYPAEVVALKSGFGAGWFTCGGELLNATQYTPGAVAEYPQSCDSNGIVGKVVYNAVSYTFTESDSTRYALGKSVDTCSMLYTPICTTISKLPPYSCSRTLHQGFFSCAATAVANAQFLVQLLIFFSAMLLPYLSATFPTTDTGTGGSKSDNSVEMVHATTVNAVHAK